MGKKRPAKPPDRHSVPRFEKANSSSAQSATLDALGKITNAEITPEHFETYAREVSAIGNDRGAAILLAVQLEDVLGYALTLRLKIPNNKADEVFGHNAAMCEELGMLLLTLGSRYRSRRRKLLRRAECSTYRSHCRPSPFRQTARSPYSLSLARGSLGHAKS
jgi:hypothetical protein